MKIDSIMPTIYDMIPYEYEKIKNSQYEDIIEGFLAGVEPSKKPKIVQISGIPGSGKSTFCKNMPKIDGVLIGFDFIMDKIPEYQNDLLLMGGAESFKKWELPARVIGYELLRRAINRRLNIIFDHSGVNEAHIEMFEYLKEIGYETEVCFLLCDVDVAHKRTMEREKVIKRHTPLSLILERAALVEQYVERYANIADDMRVFDSSDGNLVLKKSYCKENKAT